MTEVRNQKSEVRSNAAGSLGRFVASSLRRSIPLRRSAFSLPEVMFAIMILGIGFIMVAAMFPVAIQQAKANKESVTATMVAQRAMRCLEQAGQNTTGGVSVLPSTAGVYAYTQNLANPTTWVPSNFWMSVRGEMIEPSDPRFAWIALYSRATIAAGAELNANVVIFVVGCQEASQYDPVTDLGLGAAGVFPPALFNLQPRLVEVRAVGGRLQFQPPTAASFGGPVPPNYTTHPPVLLYPNTDPANLADGSFVVIASGLTTAGRVLQINDVQPGPSAAAPNPDAAVRVTDDLSGLAGWTPAWMVGRTYSATGYAGKAQDIAVYKGVIRVPYQ